MAYTKIIVIHHTLNKSLDYVINPEKTVLENAADYIMNSDKTEKGLFVSTFNCSADTVYAEMMQTKSTWGKLRGVLGYHVVQSFKPNELTPGLAHRIGCEFVNRCLALRYEVVVTTHLDKNHLHNHIIFNSVSFADGTMYRNNFTDYYRDIRAVSDMLCKEYGLSVIMEPEHRGKHYVEWKAGNEGKSTWRGIIREDVDRAIKASVSFQAFVRRMREQGYEVKTGVKHIAVRPQGKERFVRLRSLGERYTEEAIKRRILSRKKPEYLPRSADVKMKPVKYNGTFTLHKVTWKGLRALYFHYLHMLRKAQRSPNEAVFLLREDLVHLDKFTAQAKLLGRNKIDTAEQLEVYRKDVESRIDKFTAKRKLLTYEKRKIIDEPTKAEIAEKIGEISKQLKSLRRERKLCDDIAEYSVFIKEKEEQMKKVVKQEVKESESRRCGRSNREHGA